MSNNNVRTVYIHLVKNTPDVATTKEIIKGKVYADFDMDGRVVGFEFLDPIFVEVDGELK